MRPVRRQRPPRRRQERRSQADATGPRLPRGPRAQAQPFVEARAVGRNDASSRPAATNDELSASCDQNPRGAPFKTDGQGYSKRAHFDEAPSGLRTLKLGPLFRASFYKLPRGSRQARPFASGGATRAVASVLLGRPLRFRRRQRAQAHPGHRGRGRRRVRQSHKCRGSNDRTKK